MRKYKVGDEVLPNKTLLNYREVAQKFSGQKGVIKQLSTVSTIYEVEFIHQSTSALFSARAWFDDSWLMPTTSKVLCNCSISKILLRGCKDPNHF